MTIFIATTVQWVILPLIMFAIFAFAWIIANSARTAELRVSSWAGFWAGLLSFVVYVVSQLSQIQEPKLQYADLPGLQLLPFGWGLSTGFVFLWFVRHAVPTRLVGLITLMLAGTSTSAVFTYVFIDSTRVPVLYWTLGMALGIILHIVLFPSSIVPIFPPARRRIASWPMPSGIRWRGSSPRRERRPPASPGEGSRFRFPAPSAGHRLNAGVISAEESASHFARGSSLTGASIMCMVISRPIVCGSLGESNGRGPKMRLNVVELRQSLAEVLNRAEYQGERIIIHRRGKDVAAIVPLEDLKLLERLIEEVEDRLDVEAARVSMAESEDCIPYADVRRRLGLDDEQKAKRKRAQPRAKTV